MDGPYPKKQQTGQSINTGDEDQCQQTSFIKTVLTPVELFFSEGNQFSEPYNGMGPAFRVA
jgi:hypothetical protein